MKDEGSCWESRRYTLDEQDSEGMTKFWIQAKAPGRNPKVHLQNVECLKAGDCECICSHLHLGKNVVVSRCTRRCGVKGGHSDHYFSLHTKPKREGQN